MKRLISFMLAFGVALTAVSTPVFADVLLSEKVTDVPELPERILEDDTNSDDLESKEENDSLDEEYATSSDFQDFYISQENIDEIASNFMPVMALNEDVVALKKTREEKYIDRLVDADGYIRKAYEIMEIGLDGKSGDAPLIDLAGESVETLPNGSIGIPMYRYTLAEERESAKYYAAAIVGAFERDHPEVFWINKTKYAFCTDVGNNTVYLILKDKKKNYDFRLNEYADAARLRTAIEERDSIAETILSEIPEDASPYEQVKAINSWLTHNNEYNTIVANNTDVTQDGNVDWSDTYSYGPWTCMSALRGSTGIMGPVCEGYSKAFKYLCDKLGIPCVIVTGTDGGGGDHMWCYVKMDGAWYGVDVTKNDPVTSTSGKVSGNESEAYLLSGSNTNLGWSTGNKTFAETHKEDNTYVDGIGPSFNNGPELSKEAYQPEEDVKHTYTVESVEWNITKEPYSATFTLVCSDCQDKQTVKAASVAITAETEAKCESKGSKTFTAICSYNGQKFSEKKTVEVPALGHEFNDPVMKWNVKGLNDVTATASRECSRGCGKTEEVAAQVTHKQSQAPTCTVMGKTTYTATANFTNPDTSFTATKEVQDIPKIAHTYEAEFTWNASTESATATVVLTCSQCGDTVSGTADVAEKNRKDADCTTAGSVAYEATYSHEGKEYKETKTVEIPALGHDYEATFTWDTSHDPATASVTLDCTRCDDTHTAAATVSELKRTPATAEEVGSVQYKASYEYNGQTYEDEETVTLPATGHHYGEPVFEWIEDYRRVKATFTCTDPGCGDEQIVYADSTSVEKIPATCTKKGTHTYSATVHFGEKDYPVPSEDVQDIPALGHEYKEPEIEWHINGLNDVTATVTRACKRDCGEKQVVEAQITHSQTKDPTCTEMGETTYTATASFEGLAEAFTESKTVKDVPMIPHNYGDPVFEWSEDHSTAKAKFTCTVCQHEEELDATVGELEVTDPTCTQPGGNARTATVEFNDETYTDRWVDGNSIPALGHDYTAAFDWNLESEPVTATVTLTCSRKDSTVTKPATVKEKSRTPATEESAGSVVYEATLEYEGKSYKDEQTKVLPMISHHYGEPVFEWESDYSRVKATFTCTDDDCGDVQVVYANSTSVVKIPATCTEMGTHTYSATVHFGSQDYPAPPQDVQDIPALGHEYGEPEIEWHINGFHNVAATVTRTCTRDCGDVQTQEAEISYVQSKEPTCTEKGETTYTATASFDGLDEPFTATKTIQDVPMIPHSYGNPVFEWGADHTTAKAKFTCTVCDHTETVDATVGELETTEPTCTLPGGNARTATVEFEDNTYMDRWVDGESIPALGHDYAASFDWNVDGDTVTATVTLVCSRHDSTITQPAVVKETDRTDATCDSAGSVTYEATYSLDSNEYRDEKTIEIPALGHKFEGEPVFEWSEDYSAAMAVRFCLHDKSHREETKADVTSSEVQADCVNPGGAKYTAVVVIGGQTYTDEKIKESEPALGHKWSNSWSQDEVSHWHECEHDNCPVENNSEKDGYAKHTIVTKVTKEPTTEEEGTMVYVCDVCGYVAKTITLDKLDDNKKPGKVDSSVDNGNNSLDVGFESDDLLSLLTKEEQEMVENGVNIEFKLRVKSIKESNVPTEDIQAIKDKVPNASGTKYVDISLVKIIGNKTEVPVNGKLPKSVTLTITIPEELRVQNRRFAIAHVHDGVVTVGGKIDANKDWALTFDTDSFSTFALLWQDTAGNSSSDNNNSGTGSDKYSSWQYFSPKQSGSSSGNGTNTPAKTADRFPGTELTIILLLSMSGIAAASMMLKKKRQLDVEIQ